MLLSLLGPLSTDTSSWIKSTRSADSACCVEAAYHEDLVFVRDSKYRRGLHQSTETEEVIAVTRSDWKDFVETVRLGVPGSCGDLILELASDQSARLASKKDGAVLDYTTDEWRAFVDGVVMGEFSIDLLANAA